MPSAMRKLYIPESEEELLTMTREDVTEGLTDREQRFCEYYCRNMNIKIAAVKAGYGEKSAHMVGYKVRRKPLVNRYICWLKLLATKEHCITAADIVDKYARIAFADITDFVKIEGKRITLIDGDKIDGQLITEIKQGKDGVTIKLADQMRALEKLELYFDVMPADWKQKVEERKLELMKERLEIDRIKAGQGAGEEIGNDGFIDALKATAQEVWDEERS